MKQTGFFNRLLAAVLFVVLVLSMAPVAQAETQHGYVLIPGTGGDRVVNFRRDPNTDDNANYPLARLPEYWVMEILGSITKGSQTWYHVQTNIGVGENDPVKYQTGYVMSNYVKVMSPEEEERYGFVQGNYFHTDPEAGIYTNFAADTPVKETIPKIIPTGTVLGYVFIVNGDATIYDAPAGSPNRFLHSQRNDGGLF